VSALPLRLVGFVVAALAMTALLAACGSTPTAAPVIERSPNARVASKPAPTNPVVPAAASRAQAPTPPAESARVVAPAPVASAKSEIPPAAAAENPPTSAAEKLPATSEEPTTKPYREGDWRPEYHIVKKGDTLYSIALDYGQDYRELAAWNNLADPSLIKIDQRLRLFPPESTGKATISQPTPLAAPVATPIFSEPKARKLPYSDQALAQLKTPAAKAEAGSIAPNQVTVSPPGKSPSARPSAVPSMAPAQKEMPPGDGKMTWEWPAQGKLLYGFGQGPNQKGIGIEGRIGQPVLAAGPGKVVYSGSGLRGYGKLIIIKHNAVYLSVYAHNNQILVKEGQSVAMGQKIAEMGSTDSNRVDLHFEIRRLGKPIDPLQYLPDRAS
jgi:lipoprotein NlpD